MADWTTNVCSALPSLLYRWNHFWRHQRNLSPPETHRVSPNSFPFRSMRRTRSYPDSLSAKRKKTLVRVLNFFLNFSFLFHEFELFAHKIKNKFKSSYGDAFIYWRNVCIIESVERYFAIWHNISSSGLSLNFSAYLLQRSLC